MSEFKVLISSTRKDIAPYREEVKNKLVALHQVVLMMETFGSNPSDAVTVSTDQVRECDLFVGIYAYRYGYVPEGDDKSITEQEYDLARELGKRCLCYVASESLKPEIIEEDETKQQRLVAFKQRLDVELVRTVFDSPDDLREKVGDDVNRLLLGNTFYPLVAEKAQNWFWEKYSYTGPAAVSQEQVGKWLSLNELNRSQRTGLELIRRTLGTVTNEDRLALDRVNDNPSLLNNLCSPFIAGVLLDLRDKLPLESLVDLNFIEFVTHFWKKRLAHLDTSSLDADLTKLSVALIARSLLKREGHPALTEVLMT